MLTTLTSHCQGSRPGIIVAANRRCILYQRLFRGNYNLWRRIPSFRSVCGFPPFIKGAGRLSCAGKANASYMLHSILGRSSARGSSTWRWQKCAHSIESLFGSHRVIWITSGHKCACINLMFWLPSTSKKPEGSILRSNHRIPGWIILRIQIRGHFIP